MTTTTANTPQRRRIHPHKFVLYVAMASIVMMFAGLTSAYIVKEGQPGWESIESPQAFIWSTVAIVLSSITMQWALRSFRQRDMMRFRILLLATWVLGIAFVVLQWQGFTWMWDRGVRWRGASAGQFLYIIAGLHALHVLGGLVALTIMNVKAWLGRNRSYNVVPVDVMTTYWHFVDLLWLYLLVFFVWLG